MMLFLMASQITLGTKTLITFLALHFDLQTKQNTKKNMGILESIHFFKERFHLVEPIIQHNSKPNPNRKKLVWAYQYVSITIIQF